MCNDTAIVTYDLSCQWFKDSILQDALEKDSSSILYCFAHLPKIHSFVSDPRMVEKLCIRHKNKFALTAFACVKRTSQLIPFLCRDPQTVSIIFCVYVHFIFFQLVKLFTSKVVSRLTMGFKSLQSRKVVQEVAKFTSECLARNKTSSILFSLFNF